MELSIRSMKHLIKSQTDKRVSESSCRVLAEELEEFGDKVSEEAIEVARNRDRQTVKERDDREALSSVY